MATIDCPWCEEATSLPFPLPEETDARFRCHACGITIDWAEEPVELELAA